MGSVLSFQPEPEPVDLLIWEQYLELKLLLQSLEKDIRILKDDVDCIRDKVC